GGHGSATAVTAGGRGGADPSPAALAPAAGVLVTRRGVGGGEVLAGASSTVGTAAGEWASSVAGLGPPTPRGGDSGPGGSPDAMVAVPLKPSSRRQRILLPSCFSRMQLGCASSHLNHFWQS